MTREIKFRFYRPSSSKMICDVSFTSKDLIEEDDWKVMQFTNIKDKTGIDIYEGDICKDHMNDEIKEVEYEYGAWSWQYYESPELFWEVIGNIHEYKELI